MSQQDDRSTFPVMAERCSQCLFGPHKIVSDARRAELLAECQRKGTYFVCHKSSIMGGRACCRGFYDRDPRATLPMRLADYLGVVRFVEEGDSR